jgi:plasmid stabilization system protein ParE
MYIVTYEPEAENDLFEIVFYYAEQGGFELAETINNRIRDHIKRLETMPFRATESVTVPNSREFLIERLPYKAFYRVDETSKKVLVLNIVHTSRKHP